jgi:hypothetical protein
VIPNSPQTALSLFSTIHTKRNKQSFEEKKNTVNSEVFREAEETLMKLLFSLSHFERFDLCSVDIYFVFTAHPKLFSLIIWNFSDKSNDSL